MIILKYKNKVLWTIRIAVSIFILIILSNKIDSSILLGILNKINYNYLVLAFIFKLLGVVFSTIIWQNSLEILGEKFSFKNLFQYYLISHFFNNIAPGTVGGDLKRISNIVKSNGYTISITSVILERLIGFTILASIVTFASFYIHLVYGLSSFFFISFPVLLLILFTLYYTFNTNNVYISKYLLKLNMANFKLRNKILIYRMSTFSLLFYLTTILSIWAIMNSISIDTVPFYFYFIFVPLIVFLLAIPISIQGLGVRESAFIYFLSFYGVNAESAVAVSILSFTLMLLISMLGFIVWIHKKIND